MADGIAGVTSAIKNADGPAICGYVTAGFPDPGRFEEVIVSVAREADVVEVGVPFTDPMADGQTIQEASHVALEHGVTLDQILDTLGTLDLAAPHVLMGYYNPFLSYGLDRLAARLVEAGTAGLIVPDLPHEEATALSDQLESAGLGLVQLVAPTTPEDRLQRLAKASRGFVYAVATKGTTGSSTTFDTETLAYLDRVRSVSDLPVLAGFGIRTPQQVAAVASHVDGVVIGSALIEVIKAGDDPAAYLATLRGGRN